VAEDSNRPFRRFRRFQITLKIITKFGPPEIMNTD